MMQSFVLGGGCFWCIDALYRHFKGVQQSVCGYAGGHTDNPDYRSVCSGTTGHIEVDKVVFDERLIPAETILDIFFSSHDPTSWDRQGADIGSQYRSALFYTDEQQRAFYEAAKERAEHLWGAPVVTVIEPLEKFWPAEEYHQNYYAKNPFEGYCRAIISPKVAQVRKEYAQYLL